MGIWSLFVILFGVGVATKWICLWVNFMATLQLREIMKKVLRVGHVKMLNDLGARLAHILLGGGGGGREVFSRF